MNKPITGFLAYAIAGRSVPAKTVHAKCLMLYYCANVDAHGSFFRSMFDICYDTRLSESTVRRLNKEWKSIGLLSWVEGSNLTEKANVYTLDLEKLQAFAATRKPERERIKKKVLNAARQQRFRDKNVTLKRNAMSQSNVTLSQSNVTPVTLPVTVYEPMHEPNT